MSAQMKQQAITEITAYMTVIDSMILEYEARIAARDGEDGVETTASAPSGGPVWTVREKDTLYSIARWTMNSQSRWRDIHALNRELIGDNPGNVKPGMKLVLPADARIPNPLPINEDSENPASTGLRWTVRKHDSLIWIARWTLNSEGRWKEIHEMNRELIGDNPKSLGPGMRLVLPADATIPNPLPVNDFEDRPKPKPVVEDRTDDEVEDRTDDVVEDRTDDEVVVVDPDEVIVDKDVIDVPGAHMMTRTMSIIAADMINQLDKSELLTIKTKRKLTDDSKLKVSNKLDVKLAERNLIPKPGHPFFLGVFGLVKLGAAIELGINLLYGPGDFSGTTPNYNARPVGGSTTAFLGSKLTFEVYGGFDLYGLEIKVFAKLGFKLGFNAKVTAHGDHYIISGDVPLTTGIVVGYNVAKVFEDSYEIGSAELLRFANLKIVVYEDGRCEFKEKELQVQLGKDADKAWKKFQAYVDNSILTEALNPAVLVKLVAAGTGVAEALAQALKAAGKLNDLRKYLPSSDGIVDVVDDVGDVVDVIDDVGKAVRKLFKLANML